MNKIGRSVLFLVLAAPVLVYAFLKVFGKNKFDLPVLHLTDAEWPSACAAPVFPYTINDSLRTVLTGSRPAVVVWGDLPAEAGKRFPVEMDTSGIRVIQVAGFGWPCVFGADSSCVAAMIDAGGNIRSLYKALGRDEADRVIMESKILLNDY